MTTLEPELLMRYADDEVSLPERRLVEERLPADPEARNLLASFRTQRHLMPAAFNIADDDQDQHRFEHAINQAFQTRRRRQQRKDIHRWALPLAASVLITIIGGLFATYYADQRIQSETTRILAEQATRQAQDRELALQTRIDALERIISGNSLTWTSDATGATGTITPLRTYQAPDGQWCREFFETGTAETREEGRFSIACRDDGGTWKPPVAWPPQGLGPEATLGDDMRPSFRALGRRSNSQDRVDQRDDLFLSKFG